MNALTEIAPPPAESLLNFVARAVSDPAIDVAKLQVLLDMQRQIVADDARLQYNRAMSAAQAEMTPVVRDAKNDQTNSKYARLETIDADIRPIYTAHGFCLEFSSEPIDGPDIRIVCEVSHTAGYTKRYQLDAPPDTVGPQGKANKTPLHGLGSTVSYLRRYLVCMIFNIVLKSEDNDGNRQQRSAMVLTQAQAEDLWTLMDRGRIHESTVLDKMVPALGLRSITQLPAADYGRIRSALLSRINVLGKRGIVDEQRAAADRAAAARAPRGAVA